MSVRMRCLCGWLLVLFCAASLWGQITSRVTGVVQDKSGAVVSGAKVTLTNEATNVSLTTTTTSAGTYTFDGIQPGRYKITVEMQGFKTFVSGGNVLTIGQPMTVNSTLELGSVQQTVEVLGGAELVQTSTSGNVGTLVDQIAVTTLPIVGTRGRNPLQFVEIVPGVIDAGGYNQTGANVSGGGVSVNGSRDRAWNYTLDGIDINETSAGGSNFSPLRTNPDSISEFRVLTANFTAEYGRNSGAEVTMVTRSGTNEFHGNGFFFYQTPGLLANDPVNKSSIPLLPREQFVQKIPGFSLGGPIRKDKTFVFTNLQVLRTLRTVHVSSTVLTASALKGSFRYVTGGNCGTPCRNRPAGTSGASVDASGNVLAGVNVSSYDIAANDAARAGLDPTIQSLITKTPLPNNFTVGDGLNIAAFDWQAPEFEKQADWVIKVDHTFSDRNSVFVRWAHGHQNTLGDTVNGGSPPFPGAPDAVDTNRSPRNLAINWRWNPTNRMTNEFVAGMNRFKFSFANGDPNFAKNPPFTFNTGIALPAGNFGFNARALTTYQLADNLSYVRGAHVLKGGINFRYARHIDSRWSIGNFGAQPIVDFDPSVNNVDATAFKLPNNINSTDDLPALRGAINDLLGRVGTIKQGLVALNDQQYAPPGAFLHADFRMPEYDFYGQDTWRLKRNLVVDLGLRWEIRLSPRVTNSQSMLHPNQPIGFGLAPSNTITWVPGQLYRDRIANFQPSIGLAWDPWKDGKTSLRTNFRIASDRMNSFSLSSGIFQGFPGLSFQAINSSFGQAGGRVRDGIPVVTAPAGVTPVQFRQPPSFGRAAITVVDPNWQPSQVYQWSLGIQRQIAPNTVLEMNYIGHRAVHLYGAYDANQVEIFSNGFLDAFKILQAGGTNPLIDQLLANDSRKPAGMTGSQWLPNSTSPYFSAFNRGSVAEVAYAIAQRTEGGMPLVVKDGLSPFFFLLYPQFSGAMNVLDSNDFSTYHALQTTVRRNFTHGLMFQAAYTWAKSMDTRSFDPTFSRVGRGSSPFSASSTPFDLHNRKLNYAPSDFDRTHVFQAFWVYELPFGRGRSFGSHWNAVIDRILGGWELGGLGIIESGRPTTIYAQSNTISQVVRTPANCAGCPADLLQLHFDPTIGMSYITPEIKAKFSTPAPGTFSNVGRNAFRLAGYKTMNLSVGKKTRITERQSLETRLDIQNLTNSEEYDQMASNLFTNPSFGKLNPAVLNFFGLSLSSNPRRMQLSVKYNF